MKYFLDFEFIEGFTKPFLGLFGKRRHFIDLISVGVVSEDGREYYAISNEFNEKDADQWVRENIIRNLEPKTVLEHKYHQGGFEVPNPVWKNNAQITKDLIDFFNVGIDQNIEIYTYFGAYDHVLLCSLFGTMAMLPKGMPMFTRDLKQMAVERKFESSVLMDQSTHNALGDAKLNAALYMELLKYKHAPFVLDPRRRSGNTTRQADDYIQRLLIDGYIYVEDHHGSARSNRSLAEIINHRMSTEHPFTKYHVRESRDGILIHIDGRPYRRKIQ